jgi:RNA polymerase sigma-54 factor
MHESTVSRVTTNKYVHTPQGIFELKYFFNSAVNSINGEAVASESVKEHLKNIIKSEDKTKPYSDQEVADMLKRFDVNVARRTVAKYRETLGILPSRKRRIPY